MKTAEQINTSLDWIRDTDPLATLAQDLIKAGVTEGELAAAMKHRLREPIAVALQNAYRDVSHGVPTVNKWGVTCKLRKKR
jgi:hypothetical protein